MTDPYSSPNLPPPSGQPMNPYAPPPTPSSGGSGKKLWIILGAVLLGLLLLCGGGAVALVVIGSDAVKEAVDDIADERVDAPEVGECLSVTGTINAEHETHDCDELDATYEVTSDDGDCDENETTYVISLGTGNTGNVADLCLILNADEGDCLSLGVSTEEKVDCAATKGTSLKVASVGNAGDTCAVPGQPLEYATRDVLLCLVDNG
ncbi:hypothetical protein ASE01_06375 [Nocardioides sp. Root190]|uniref:LppU/SCO3897 family protein n=1 Tax=Nocardioides sp. Root190 TaxID=1736488 RepID=UPI0006F787F0|nr:hypothetical protein [Nocardioides sp. Root190]KRB77816.1 hypothetical protein ASE01_06375 [Nocardioides sp. Root190]